jgi:hypothetical protein
MALSMNNDIQIDNDLNSQPEPSVNTTNTSKRSPTESPDQLPATQKQILRQTRKRISEILVKRPPSPREIQMLQIKSLRLLQVQMYWIKSFPSLQKRLAKH